MQQTATPRVLIVDDEEDLCQYLKLMISKKANYEVDIATDGAAAFEKIKGERFNLVISDINMPKMNGIELLNNIKNYDPDIEVIMLTGKSSLETAVQALQHNAFDYIEKPVESRKLLVAMGNALGKQRLNLELKAVLERVSRERKELKAKLDQQAADLARKERLAITGAVAATLTSELMAPVDEVVAKLAAIHESKGDAAGMASLATAALPSAQRVQQILRDIVRFSEQSKLNAHPVNVAAFVQRMVEYHGERHPDLKFVVSGQTEGLEISADEDKLASALASIVENASDAMGNRGEIGIDVSTEKSGGESRVVFRLRDSGPGIPADQADKVFLPFFTTKGSKGSGLGLTIARRIVEDHHGELRIESSADKGACFVASIPAA
ncbi:MAG: response regulator [Candidatus Wallbacteria bacterium]|nr:response regulator [Candidatus Wallbacteria bacterium]